MARIRFNLNMSGYIEAATIEDAAQQLDFAINFQSLKERGVVVVEHGNGFQNLSENERLYHGGGLSPKGYADGAKAEAPARVARGDGGKNVKRSPSRR